MKLALVVLTYNRSEALRPVLQSLARQCGPDEEIVVADDGSRTEHVQAVCDVRWGFRCSAKHVWHPDVGFTAASARNMGILQTTAPYIVFLDGDCIPGLDFVAQHRRLARQGCFVNGSRVLLSPRLTQQVVNLPLDVNEWTVFDWLRARVQGDANKLTHLLRWPVAWRKQEAGFRWKGIRSCNFAAWRDDLLAIDGFDETFNGWAHEDADLVLRLHHLGVKRVNGFAATEVFHLWHQENPRANEEKNRARVHARIQSGQVRSDVGLDARMRAHAEGLDSVSECTSLS